MDLPASACRGAARVKAERAPRVAGSEATPRRPAPGTRRGPDRHREGGDRTEPILSVAPGVVGALGGRAVPSSGGVLVRRAPAHPLQQRQLTQAPGARADVTLRHVCRRPGTLGLAEPPCGPRSSAWSSWQRRSGFPAGNAWILSVAAARGRFSAVAEASSSGRGRGRSLPTLPRGPTPTRTGLQPEGQLLARRGRGPRARAPGAGRGWGRGSESPRFF